MFDTHAASLEAFARTELRPYERAVGETMCSRDRRQDQSIVRLTHSPHAAGEGRLCGMSHHTSLFPAPAEHDEAEHRSAANRALLFSAVVLAAAGAVELIVALFTRSVGLLGDALHNLSDVSTSALVFVGFLVSRRPSTDRYPYGYERAEDIAGIGVAAMIWASAVLAGWASVHKLVSHGTTDHLALGMIAAVGGIVANRVVARYKRRVGTAIQSATLLADARHSWLDALSSLGALVGLIAVALGASWGDPVAGFAVTAFIVHVGWEVTRDLVGHLMDGVDPQIITDAKAAARLVPDVVDADARARWSGRSLMLDLDIGLDPHTELADATHISEAVRRAVLSHIEQARVVDVRPHAPEETDHPTRHD
jgi:cation diffusion facilitator family transporter